MFFYKEGLLVLLCLLQLTSGWQTNFDYRPCYEKRMEERMPLSVDNLIALIEQFERDHSNTAPENIAEALLHRYRTNGVVYSPNTLEPWSTHQLYEVAKQDLDDKLLKPTVKTPIDAFIPREECSLHLSISHSTDPYPQAGVDTVWDNNYINNRKKRAVESQNLGYNYGLFEPSIHPIEFGVVQSNAGPIAGGLLLSGIMTMTNSRTYSVADLLGKSNVDTYMPTEMMGKKIDQLYGSTLSGKLGQAAVLALSNDNDYKFEIGPLGRFGNCTSCARIFTLQNSKFSHFSRAEVFSSVDAMIIASSVQKRGDSENVMMSEILRMYYSEHGFFNEDLRACNRNNVYNMFKDTYSAQIKEYALNYMYAYQSYFPDVREMVKRNDFTELEKIFTAALDDVIKVFEQFITSYSFEDYSRCPVYDNRDFQLESETDLVSVFTPTGTVENIDKQAQYISASARKIGVGYHRSRMAIYNGRTMNWLTPMVNYSNIADYSCNYTTFMNYASISSQDFIAVLDDLTIYYRKFYSYVSETDEQTGMRNQIVLWNLPLEFSTPSDTNAPRDAWDLFNMTFPDVNFIFVGEEPANFFSSVFWGGGGDGSFNRGDDKVAIVSNSPTDPLEIAAEIVANIVEVPRMFIFPGCDTSNVSYANYNEGSHRYTNFVTPNFTTLIRIPPQNFRFSEQVKLMFDRSETDICVSREHSAPSRQNTPETTECKEGSTGPEFLQKYLCDRYVEECEPIYISVTGQNSVNAYCSDPKCKFPNQIEFVMTHEGMICGSWAILPAPLLLAVAIILHFLRV